MKQITRNSARYPPAWVIELAALLYVAGCGGPELERVEYNKPPDEVSRLVDVPVADVDASPGNRTRVPAIPQIASGSQIRFEGTVVLGQHSTAPSVALLQIWAPDLDGKLRIHQSRTGLVESAGGNRVEYALQVAAPKQPGNYQVRLQYLLPEIGNVTFAEGELTVLGR